jgi:hypothetical protein
MRSHLHFFYAYYIPCHIKSIRSGTIDTKPTQLWDKLQTEFGTPPSEGKGKLKMGSEPRLDELYSSQGKRERFEGWPVHFPISGKEWSSIVFFVISWANK